MSAADLPRATVPAAGPRQLIVQAVARDLGLDSGVVEKNVQLLSLPHELPSDLHVLSAKREPFRGGWLLRLGCRQSQNLLPFDVVLNTPELDLAASARHSVTVSADLLGRTPTSANSGPHDAVVHKGERVEAVEEFGTMKLVAQAVCLDAGMVSERVRVRNISSHRVVMATVAGPKRVAVGVEP